MNFYVEERLHRGAAEYEHDPTEVRLAEGEIKHFKNSPLPRWRRCYSALCQPSDSCWRSPRWLLLLLHKVSSLSSSSDISPKCVGSCSESPGGVWTWGEKMCWGEVVRTRTPRYPWISWKKQQYCQRESFIKGRKKKGKRNTDAPKTKGEKVDFVLRVWGWKMGGKEVRVKTRKPLRSHQCPQLWDCAEEEQVNFSHWSVSLLFPPPSHSLPLSLIHTHSLSHSHPLLPLLFN